MSKGTYQNMLCPKEDIQNNQYTSICIRAATCDFQECGIFTSVDSDEAWQPPFKLRNSKCWLTRSLIVVKYSNDWQRL